MVLHHRIEKIEPTPPPGRISPCGGAGRAGVRWKGFGKGVGSSLPERLNLGEAVHGPMVYNKVTMPTIPEISRTNHSALASPVAPAWHGAPRAAFWHRRMSWISLGLSLLVHLVLILSSLVNVAVARVGTNPGRPESDFDITITNETPLTEIIDASLETDAPAVILPTDLPELPTEGIMEGAAGADAPGAGPGLGEIADGLGGAGGGDIGDGAGLGGGGGGTAKFFGVEARGSRFAYIVDISGSMNEEQGRKLNELKDQLKNSVGGMLEHMSFFVIGFNHELHFISGGKAQWVKASIEIKRSLDEKVDQLEADGGTNPKGAIEQVFKLGARPDAVYLMTDGAFNDSPTEIFALLGRINKGSKKVPIHCIGFGDAVDEEMLRRIAAESGGTYRHVKGSR